MGVVTLNKRCGLCAEDRRLLTHSLQMKVTIMLQPLRSAPHLLYTPVSGGINRLHESEFR